MVDDFTKYEVEKRRKKGDVYRPYNYDKSYGIKFDTKGFEQKTIHYDRALPQWWLDKLRSGNLV